MPRIFFTAAEASFYGNTDIFTNRVRTRHLGARHLGARHLGARHPDLHFTHPEVSDRALIQRNHVALSSSLDFCPFASLLNHDLSVVYWLGLNPSEEMHNACASAYRSGQR